MRWLCLLLAGCSSSPCDGLPEACLAIEVRGQIAALDELDLVVTRPDQQRVNARDGELDGSVIPLPAHLAAVLPNAGDGSFTLEIVGASHGAAIAYGKTTFQLPPGRQQVTMALSPLDVSNAIDLGEFHVGNDLSVAADLAAPEVARDLAGADLAGADLAAAPSVDLAHVPSWTALSSGTSYNLISIWSDAAGNVVAVGEHGTILYSGDSGATWKARASGTTSTLYTVWGISINDLWVVGVSTVLHTGNGGASWSVKTPSVDGTYASVWASSSSNVYVVGGEIGGGLTFHSSNGGSDWETFYDDDLMFSVWGTSADDIYRSGASGFLRHSGDNGLTWDDDGESAGDDLGQVWGPAPGSAYVVGAKGVLMHSADTGVSWTTLPSGTTRTLNGVWGESADSIFVVGTGGFVLHGTNAGQTWTPESSGTSTTLSGVFGGGGAVYAAGNGGTLLKRQ